MRPFTTDPGWFERHWYGTAARRRAPVVGRQPASPRSLWTMTLGLAAYFLTSSFIAAVLATHYGWLGPR